jgi:hypothetical protein
MKMKQYCFAGDFMFTKLYPDKTYRDKIYVLADSFDEARREIISSQDMLIPESLTLLHENIA